jgi:hypothetical protein
MVYVNLGKFLYKLRLVGMNGPARYVDHDGKPVWYPITIMGPQVNPPPDMKSTATRGDEGENLKGYIWLLAIRNHADSGLSSIEGRFPSEPATRNIDAFING